MNNRHDRYWQTAYPKFFVAQNGLKKESRNIIFFFNIGKQYLTSKSFFNTKKI
jgi:hypothetical protein